jgi:cytochrome c oxidase assembly factor CtaG
VDGTLRPSAHLCWAIERRRWALATANIVAALLFVVGCVAFYFPSLYVPGITLFLAGSVLMLLSAAAETFRHFGPSQ